MHLDKMIIGKLTNIFASLLALHKSLSPFLAKALFQHQPLDDAEGMASKPEKK